MLKFRVIWKYIKVQMNESHSPFLRNIMQRKRHQYKAGVASLVAMHNEHVAKRNAHPAELEQFKRDAKRAMDSIMSHVKQIQRELNSIMAFPMILVRDRYRDRIDECKHKLEDAISEYNTSTAAAIAALLGAEIMAADRMVLQKPVQQASNPVEHTSGPSVYHTPHVPGTVSHLSLPPFWYPPPRYNYQQSRESLDSNQPPYFVPSNLQSRISLSFRSNLGKALTATGTAASWLDHTAHPTEADLEVDTLTAATPVETVADVPGA
ncbi:hypothetical protein D9615_006631 [Tricholomella constricta]|uniref:Uncharacterized protein n=1 Tax=Tricholomella constricta TaxID=117010 RepID=A0A8H5HA80_9AGAR|nr:hypothetical protein D9615_006631 [Tricholomella constricta]